MRVARPTVVFTVALCIALIPQSPAQPPARAPQPEFVRQAQQLVRQGKLEHGLAIYEQELKTSPDSVAALNGAGVILDLMGRGAEARKRFTKAIESASSPQQKAAAERAMAMSYAFEGDCAGAAKYEQMVFDYYVSVNDSYQQGEIADEAARVCIDAGDLETAYHWYKKGHDAGMRETGIRPDRVDLWNFRWEHAQGRIAARKGNIADAEKHVAAARAILDKDPQLAQAQNVFFPYLKGYVEFYGGRYKEALSDLNDANQNDPFIQCLIGQTYEKLGDRDKANEYYRKASETTAHNPPAAFARPFARKKLGS
jgi:tetratricopeptide (TPR) repeat protein